MKIRRSAISPGVMTPVNRQHPSNRKPSGKRHHFSSGPCSYAQQERPSGHSKQSTVSMKKNILAGLFFSLSLFIFGIFPVCINAAIYDPSSADNDTRLITDEDSRNTCNEENCVPLILIHGIHGNRPPGGEDDLIHPYRKYWLNFLNYFYNSNLPDNYKIFRFHYVSDIHPVSEIAKALRNKIDNHTDSGAFPNKQFVIVAHSMGGLVARSYMNEYNHYSPSAPAYQNKKCGERILKLVTLATPHHGTPAANKSTRLLWLQECLLGNCLSATKYELLLKLIDQSIWCNEWAFDWWNILYDQLNMGISLSTVLDSLPRCSDFIDITKSNRKGLVYDNFFNIPQYDSEENEWLSQLNYSENYGNKIIAYGGYIKTNEILWEHLNSLGPIDFVKWFAKGKINDYLNDSAFNDNGIIPDDLSPYGNSLEFDKHTQLKASSVLLAKLYNQANDGLVPADSSTYLFGPISKRVLLPGYDHEGMKSDESADYEGFSLGLFDLLKDDLTNIAIENEDVAPIVEISSPTNGSTVNGSITVTATATDNVGVSKVYFYLNNVLKYQTSSPYVWPWNTANFTNGSHILLAKAYDFAGNFGLSSAITVTVNNTSGNNPPNTPTSLAQYKSNKSTGISFGGTTDERSLVMKGDVTDPDSDAVSLDVEVKPLGTTFANSPSFGCSSDGPVASGGTAVVTCSGLEDGQYHWQTRAKDRNGAVSNWVSVGGNSESAADFIVSAGSTGINYPPSVTVISPNGGETLKAGSSYEIKWLATDDKGIELVTLSYSQDGGTTWTPIPNAVFLDNPEVYQWAVPNISSTAVKVSAIAFDGELSCIDFSDGNFAVLQNCNTPSAPTLQTITPSSSSFTINWSVVSNITLYNLQQDTSSSFTSPSVVYTSNGTSWFSGEKLPGTYYYRVKAINSCGGSGWSTTKSVNIQANQGPGEITALSPANGATNQPLDVSLSWSAIHPGGEDQKFNVYVALADTTIFYPNNMKSYQQTSTTYTLSNLPYNTTVSWGIEAFDDTGDKKLSPMFHFTTIGDNAVPTGSIKINNGAATTTSYSVTLDLSATDAGSGVKHMRLSNDEANWTYWLPFVSKYSWNVADRNYGGQYGLTTYTVYAQFRDYEGNESVVSQDSITKAPGTPEQILLNGVGYETIQDAIDAASPGDIVYLTSGIYQFSGDVSPTNHSSKTAGIQMKPGITLMGEGADKTVIDVNGYAFAAIVDADNSIIEGLTIINSGSLAWRYVVLLESDSSKIRSCVIKGGATGIYVGFGDSYPSTNSQIQNNVIINNSDSGIWLMSGSNISIYNNTIANNNEKGFFGWLGSAQMVNNIIANNGIGVKSYDNPSTFRNNDVYSNNSGNYAWISDQTGISGNISENPSFVNSSTGNYALNSGSPCINTGSNVGTPYNGSAPDMGAFEYGGTGTIQVTSNHTDASFALKGPSGTYNGSGTNWSMSALPTGIYSITFFPIANSYSPSYQVKTLYSGKTLTFDGTYEGDSTGPSGTASVNFDEYATADNTVTITFDISDQVAGLSSGSEMMFSNDGATWSTTEPYSSMKKNWDITAYGGNTTSGTKTVYTKVSDALGNWSLLTDTIRYLPDRNVLEVPTQYGTIQAAIDAAQDGDMVYVLPGDYGDYHGEITLKEGVRLQGAGPTKTILGAIMFINGANRSEIDGFGGFMMINFSGLGPFIISNNWIKRGISIGWTEQQTNVIIRNNVISDNSTGIGISGTAKITIENNTFANNSYCAIHVDSATSNTKVYFANNIISNNNIGLEDSNTSDTTHQHIFPSFNTYWNNTSNFSGNIKEMGPGDMESNPLFVDVSNNDFHLQIGSSSIDSGNPETKYNDPDNTINDRGVYGGPCLNTPPMADFSIDPTQGGTGTLFTFDGSLSHDRESMDERLMVRWDRNGDGTQDTEFSVNKTFVQRYDVPGTYNVVLQVKDEKGYISSVTKFVTAINQAPNVPDSPTPGGGLSDQELNVVLRWSGGDPNIEDSVSYNVYFGNTAEPPLVSSEQRETSFNSGSLSPYTLYYWKIVSKDTFGLESKGPLWHFVTGAKVTAPTVANCTDLSVSSTSATLCGKVNPNGASTTIVFEWGTTTSYGNTANASQNPITGTTPQTASASVSGLTTGTPYHFRVKATNSAGVTFGDDKTFTPTSCTYSISPTSKSFGPGGGSSSTGVTTQSSCSWSAVSNTAWITITSGSSGNGNGSVNFTVSENGTSDSRTGNVTIAGKTFTVNQDGAPTVVCAWQRQNPPSQTDFLYSVWGSSGSDVFAVGWEPSFPGKGTIIHYDGGIWSEMTTGLDDFLLGIWGSSSSDVFAVGGNDFSGLGAILHYDGASWTPMDCGDNGVLRGIWGTSGTDVFAVGSSGTILHYDGTSWSSMTSGTTDSLFSVWGSSASDVFAVGENGTILHYDGSAWSSMTSSTSSMLRGIWGSSGNDVYVVGWVVGWESTVLHYDGISWSSISQSEHLGTLFSVWGSSGSNIFVVGHYNVGNGIIFKYDGASWKLMYSASANDIYGIWGSSASDVFAVGTGGTILHYGPIATPNVTTTALSSVTSTSASSGGNVISDGGASITVRGVCWSTSANPTISDSNTSDGIGMGLFTSALTGLHSGTTYHVRAYATNNAGTGYGSDASFKTSHASTLYVSSNKDCGDKTPCYDSIQNAIDDAATGSAILVKQGTYEESISLGSAKALLIKGGYNSTYDQQTANTTFIQAPGPTSIKASSGSLKFQMINVK